MKKYKSEVNYFVTYPVVFILLAILIFDAYSKNWFGIILFSVFLIYYISDIINTNYRITDRTLSIKSGLANKKNISIEQIKKIRSVRNFLSAPALALNKLEIHYNNFDVILISPKNKENFINELQQINPDIKIEG